MRTDIHKPTALGSFQLHCVRSEVKFLPNRHRDTHSQQKEEDQERYPSGHVRDLQAEVIGDKEIM